MAVTTLECTSHYLRAAILRAVCLTFMTFAGLIAIWCILGFYMGKNTPERKDYIMENLVVPVEE